MLANSLENDFNLIDFGLWQIAIGKDYSIWQNLLIYVSPETPEKIPIQSAIFSRFFSYITNKVNCNIILPLLLLIYAEKKVE